MTVSMRVMSAGDGYKYLLKSVAAGDGDRSLSTPLTRYYVEEGTPAGRWMGAGLPAFGRGGLKPGARVTEQQLQWLIGLGRDPLTGAPLGRSYPVYRSAGERLEERAADDRPSAYEPEVERPGAGARTGEGEQSVRRAVAAFDFTFSVPKSASVLWAVADAPLQEVIVDAHHGAVADVLAFMERELAATRVGVATADGAVAQVAVEGLVATAFDHFDSRAGDPHLHTHVVVSNKVRAVLDGGWRSLDGRPLHAATVALSELHEALFADRLSRLLGVMWEQRARGRDRNPGWSIQAVPERLVAEFSSRSRDIEVEKDRLIARYVEQHGRHPSAATVIRLRQQATLSTRPEKQVRALADLTSEWRSRGGKVLGKQANEWAASVLGTPGPLLRAGQVPADVVAGIGVVVLDRVGERRSTWRRWNLYAEAARQTMGWRLASAADREELLGAVVASAEAASVRLTPPDLAVTPVEFQRGDGSSVFRPKDSVIYSATSILEAEDRLLALTADVSGPVAMAEVDRDRKHVRARLPGLSREQADAVTAIVTSGRVLEVLVGPAGAGKTTTMAGVRAVWEASHGAGSVVGLAPSAAAAQVLGDELGVVTENTAMWAQQQQRGQVELRAGQLVIVDEASLAGTSALDRIARHAGRAGAKVLLVGDGAQLSAVEAGGAFAMLATFTGCSVELTDVHRFAAGWEREASLGIRDGNLDALERYIEHGRVRGGGDDAMVRDAYEAWSSDTAAGLSSILIATDAQTVTALNQRARADLILSGAVNTSREALLHDQTSAGVGDVVITRRNDRRLRTKRGWVRNGDRWKVRAVRTDGSVVVQTMGTRWGGRVVLPPQYVQNDVELGYAVTTYRAQGITTDTSHALVNSATKREHLYVALTRGRLSNTAHVAVEQLGENHSTRHPADEPLASALSILAGVLQHVGAAASAHQTITTEQETIGSIEQLAAEYDTIAAAAQLPRWSTLVRASGLSTSEADVVIQSEAFGPLSAALRRAEASGHDVDRLLPRLVAIRDFRDADDPAAVLHARLVRAVDPGVGKGRAPGRFIAGLLPDASGQMSESMRTALDERRAEIERRAIAVLDRSIASRATWTRELSSGDPALAAADSSWRAHAIVVAAFRDRYGITGDALSREPGMRSTPSHADVVAMERAVLGARLVAQRISEPGRMVSGSAAVVREMPNARSL